MRIRIALLAAFVLAALAASAEDFPYIYSWGEHQTIRSHGSLKEIIRISKQWSGPYIWLRRDGHEYLIRDAGVLADVRDAFAEMNALEPDMREAERKARPYERKSEELEKQIDRLSDQLGDDEDLSRSERRSMEAQLRDLERHMKAIEDDLEHAEREVERLDREQERLEKIAEKKFEAIVIRAIREGRAQIVDR